MDLDLDADADADAPRLSKLRAVPSLSDPSKSASFRQPTYGSVIAERVSGWRWKEVRTRRASALAMSRKPTPLEQCVRDKSLKRAYQARVAELKEEIRQNKVAKRKQREEREKRKKENMLHSGTKLQWVIAGEKNIAAPATTVSGLGLREKTSRSGRGWAPRTRGWGTQVSSTPGRNCPFSAAGTLWSTPVMSGT